jgi:hypothetical protein
MARVQKLLDGLDERIVVHIEGVAEPIIIGLSDAYEAPGAPNPRRQYRSKGSAESGGSATTRSASRRKPSTTRRSFVGKPSKPAVR